MRNFLRIDEGEIMANDIRIGMQLDDGGSIANKNKEAKALKQTLEAASDAAKNLRVPMATNAARQGVAASQPVSAAYKAAAQPGGGASDTNLGRGVTGSTGASAKDFAAQAQGLGGLVHVYATFAANLYAVSAAFTALSKAADTTNMVKGLDQLGAQSGKALGSLSKQLIAVSDGALSMRDAMTATALSTAGGMSNANMVRMTQVAKNASLALGRDMTDSMDRLTKGIVKIQPELLDELGIMARVIPSQEAYARQLGKSVSSLTDFEKKQAFANAVLDEGEKKFGAIKIDANPYSKLSASIQNLGQNFLELINTPIGAFVSVLANNSALLAIALAGVGKVLLNQAAPGLFAYKQNLASLAIMAKKQADDTRLSANIELENQREFYRSKDVLLMESAKKEYIETQKSNNALSDLTKKSQMDKLSQKIIGKDVRDLTKISPYELTSEDMSAMRKRSDELLKSDDELHKKQGVNLAAHLTKVTAMQQAADDAADAAVIAADKRDKNRQNVQNTLVADAAAMNKKFHLDSIKSNTAHIQATEGLSSAFKNMYTQLKAANQVGGMSVVTGVDAKTGKQLTEHIDKIGTLSRITQTASGSFDILKNSASSALGKLSTWLGKFGEIGAIVGFVVGVADLAISVLGKNGKEVEALSKSFDSLKESGDNVERTLAAIQTKDPLERMSLASTSAIANAFMGVADSIESVIKAGDKAKAKANWMDSLIDFSKRIYGGDISSKTTDSIVSSVSDSIDLLASNENLGSKFKKSMMAILKIPKLDSKSMEDALNAIDPKDRPALFKVLTEAIKDSNREFNNYSSTLQTYKAAADTAVKASQDFNITLMSSDPMFKLGIATIGVSRALQEVAKDGQASKETLQDLINDSAKLSLLTPDIAGKLIGLSSTFTKNSEAVRANADNIKVLQKAYEEAAAAEDTFIGRWKQRKAVSEGKTTEKDVAGATLQEAKKLQNQQEATQAKLQKEATILIGEAQYSAFVKGSKLVEISLGNVGEKIALGIDKAAANSLTGLQALRANTDFAKREADIAIKQLDASYENFTAMEALRFAVEESTLQQAISNEKDEGKKAALKIEAAGLKMAAEALKSGPEAVVKLQKAALAAGNTQAEGGRFAVAATDQEALKSGGIKVSPAYAQAESLRAKQAEASGKILELAAANLYTKQVLIAEEKQKELIQESGLIKYQSDRLGIMQGILQIQDLDLAKSKISLDNQAESKKQLADRTVIQGKINGLAAQIAKEGDTELRGLHKKQLTVEAISLSNLKQNQAAQNANKILQDSIAIVQIRLALAQREYDLTVAKTNLDALKQTTASDVTQAEFQAQVQLGLISDEYKAKKEASLAVSRAQLDLTIAQAAKNAEIIKIQEDADKKKLNTGKPGELGYNTDNAAINVGIQAAADASIALIQVQKDSNQVIYDGKVKILGITEATNISQAKESEILKNQASYMQDMTARTSNLATAFGSVGEAIGKAAEALQAMADDDINYLRKKAELEALKADAPMYSDAQKDATKSLIKLEDTQAKNKLKNQSAALSSVKKIFGEETLAYKAITTYEKVTSALKVYNDNKELAVTLFNLGKKAAMELGFLSTSVAAEEAADMAKATSKIPAVIMEFMNWLGPWGSAAAAVAIAAALSGNTSSASYTPPIDQGTLAGTGQQAVGSTITTREGGVLGDPTAQVNSITDSIDMLSQVFFDNMGDTSSNLIQSLKGIQENTYNTAKALGSSGVLGGGDNPFGASVGTSVNAQTGIGVIDKALSWLGMGGGGTTSNITGSGIMGTGTASGFARGQQAFQGYTDVATTTEHQWWEFRGPDTTSSRLTAKLDDSVNKAVEGIFNSFNKTLLASAEGLGQTTAGIQSILDKEVLKLSVSKVGLTGTEFAQKLTAEVNVQLNKLANLAYPFLAKYTKVGEESWMVAAKLIKDGETVNFGLSMVGKSLEKTGMSSESLVAQQQEVIENFGGTAEAFASAMSAYHNALFSDEEKAAFATSNVQNQLKKLGITGLTTKNQLKDLIATKDPTSEIYAKLVKIAPAFANAMDEVTAASTKFSDQEIKIYELLGQSSKALTMSRQKELDSMEEALRPRQIYINALTDEIKIRDKLKAAYTSSNTALTNSIKTLQDYKNALMAGAASTLTPAEKYAQAKSIFMQTATAAQAVITTTSSIADVAARDVALGKLQSTGDALASASDIMFAHGPQYIADFAAITSAIDTTASILTTQQTDQEKQLGFLERTSEATETMSTLLAEYLKAQSITAAAQAGAASVGSTAATIAIPGHAAGGLASGISMVGEKGPEIVDFINPGRVYSNQASNDLFNTKELVAEIKALRDEVTQLRADQKEQTGHLIATNYDANTRNAAAVNAATEDALKQQDWKTRSQVKVA